jgi:hypothetical protein
LIPDRKFLVASSLCDSIPNDGNHSADNPVKLPKPEKPPTMLHEIATWTFMAGLAFGAWWLYVLWPIYESEGALVMIRHGFGHWQLHVTWICLLVSFGVHVMVQKRTAGKR